MGDCSLCETLAGAAACGHHECLVALHGLMGHHEEEECNRVLLIACICGHLRCIRFLVEQGVTLPRRAMHWVVAAGSLPCVEYLREIGVEWEDDILETAVITGDLKLLMHINEQGQTNWHRSPLATFFAAAGHLDCLRYAHSTGALWHKATTARAAQGHLECLKYANRLGCPWHRFTMDYAAEGHIDCLVYCYSKKAEWGESTTTAAAVRDHADCLQFLVERGCRFSSTCPDIRRNIGTMVSALARRASARVIQRAWRVHKTEIRQRAVSSIEDAYIAWACRPLHGRWYQRARESYSNHQHAAGNRPGLLVP